MKPSKPEDPIFVDFTDALMDLPIKKVVLLANLALNRLDLRAIGEICYDADVKPLMCIKERESDG